MEIRGKNIERIISQILRKNELRIGRCLQHGELMSNLVKEHEIQNRGIREYFFP